MKIASEGRMGGKKTAGRPRRMLLAWMVDKKEQMEMSTFLGPVWRKIEMLGDVEVPDLLDGRELEEEEEEERTLLRHTLFSRLV